MLFLALKVKPFSIFSFSYSLSHPSTAKVHSLLAMRERGKTVETYRNFSDFNYSASEIPCKKHPYSSPVGVCAYCLKDRLVKLVCSECGKHRISSSCCSDISSAYRNSCSKIDAGSSGRISFLIDNEKIDHKRCNPHSKSKRKNEGSEKVVFFRRSSSSCVEVKKSNGFWRIKRLFRKRRNKGRGENCEFCDENSETYVSDVVGATRSRSLCSFSSDLVGVSRSRSLCSFRDGREKDFDAGSDYAFASAKISDVGNGIFFDSDKKCSFSCRYEARKSGFRSILDGERGGCPNEMEIDRVCSVVNRSVFPIKESDFSAVDESAFIELKLDSMCESKQDFSAAGINGVSDHAIGRKNENFEIGESLIGNGTYHGLGGSCRITTDERELKQGSRNYKVWKRIFKYHTAAK